MRTRTRVITEPQVTQVGYWRNTFLAQAGSKRIQRYGEGDFKYICIDHLYEADGVEMLMYVPKSQSDPKGILDALDHLRTERDVTTVYVIKHPDSWIEEFKELR